MADKTVDRGPWTGCAVMFLQSLCPDVNLLSLYKDQEGKFIVFKVIKLTLRGSTATPVCLHCSYINAFSWMSIYFLTSVSCGQILQEVWEVMRSWRSTTLIPSWGWRWSLLTLQLVASSWRATALEPWGSPCPSTPAGSLLRPKSSQWKPSSRPGRTSWISAWTSWTSVYSTSTFHRYAQPDADCIHPPSVICSWHGWSDFLEHLT